MMAQILKSIKTILFVVTATNEYKRSAHQDCNLNINRNKKIPCFAS